MTTASVSRVRNTSHRNIAATGLGFLFFANVYCFTSNKYEQQQASSKNTSSTTNTTTSTYTRTSARTVASLKTMPSRIAHIEPTLRSLLDHQTMPLEQLYLVLPKTKWIIQKDKPVEYEMPGFLTDLMEAEKRLVVLRPQYDYGPVDKMVYALKRESALNNNTNLIYLDDDVIYDENLVHNLVHKGLEYPDSLIGFSGCKLRSHFRQINHKFPRLRYDRHPNLYYQLSGTESLQGGDEIVDVVQGFAGVLIRPSFFEWQSFLDLVRTVTVGHDTWKSGDFIISAYLEYRNVTRRIVEGGVVPTINGMAARKDNLGRTMHRQAMQAAYDLSGRLGIWSEYSFVNYLSLTPNQKDLLDCEAGHSTYCQKAGSVTQTNATKALDKALLPP